MWQTGKHGAWPSLQHPQMLGTVCDGPAEPCLLVARLHTPAVVAHSRHAAHAKHLNKGGGWWRVRWVPARNLAKSALKYPPDSCLPAKRLRTGLFICCQYPSNNGTLHPRVQTSKIVLKT